MSQTIRSLLAIVLVLSAGVPLWLWVAQPPEAASVPPRDLGPVPVRVERVAARTVELQLEVRGNLEPSQRLGLRFERSGRLATVAEWRPGLAVEAGAVLATLDTDRIAATLVSAHARLAEAEAARDAAVAAERAAHAGVATADELLAIATREEARLVALVESGSASSALADRAGSARLAARAALEEAEAALRQSEASLALGDAAIAVAEAGIGELELELEKSRLVAPFAGVLSGRAPVVGSLVDPSVELGALVDPRPVLRGRVPEHELARLALGQSARVRLATSPDLPTAREFEARVAAIDPVVDPRLRRALVEIELEESAPATGAFAMANVTTDILEDSVWIARRHLRWRGATAVCFVLDGDVAHERELTFQADHGEGFVVASGLEVGEMLLIEPLDRLAEGTRCRRLDSR